MENDQIDPIQARLLKQTWFSQWHLFAAWLYLAIIAFDFLIAPVGHLAILAYYHYPIVQWQPISLSGGGVLHISMMAIIGISSWGRSQQMVESIRNMPDYSQMNYGSQYNGYQQPSYDPGMNSPLEPLNPPVNPASVLNAPRRGIGKL